MGRAVTGHTLVLLPGRVLSRRPAYTAGFASTGSSPAWVALRLSPVWS